jgi:hypothetical protein
MADKRHNDNTEHSAEPQNAGIEYERRDVTVSAVVKFVIALGLGIGLSLLLMRVLFSVLDRMENAEKPEPISQVQGLKKQLPPEPRIQGIPGVDFHKNSPSMDMELYLDQEQRRLGTAVEKDEDGKLKPVPFVPVVTDPTNNMVTIPIDRAMKAILEKGFKVDPNAPVSDQPNSTRRTINDEEIPSTTSSGRTTQKLRRP